MCGQEKFLGYKFLKARIMETETPTGESENFTFRMQMEDLHLLQYMPINIVKAKICRLIKECTSVKFTFKTSIIEMPASRRFGV